MSMWIITEEGEFLSEVASKSGPETRVIRARDKHSIRGIQKFVNDGRADDEEKVEIIEGAGTDYQYRVTIDEGEWIEFVTYRAEQGRGTNHKNAVAEALGKDKGRAFLRAMMETWTIWYSYQEALLRKGKSS